MTKISKGKASEALAQVAAWLGPRMGYEGPAPTGKEAAWNALGPQLVMDWEGSCGGPAPTILLEGGPYDWAVEAAQVVNVPGVFAEPYAGWALCLHPE